MPEYHGRFTGNVGRVELSLLPDASSKLETYEADALDTIYLFDLPPRERDRARQRHAGEYVLAPRLVTMYVGFDLSRPPFDDTRVRQALVLATDREALADVVMRGYLFPATGGFVPPGMPGHSAGIGLPHDPQQARRLLTEAGYPGGSGFPAVDFLTLRRDDPVSDYLGAQWQTNLGIEVGWETADVGTYLERLETEPPHMSLSGWLADYPDPDNFLRVSPHVRYTRWRNAAYDRLVEGARRAMDQDERMQLYGQADKLLIEEAVIMPLTYGRWHMLVKPWVRKYPTSAIRTWYWKDVIIEPH